MKNPFQKKSIAPPGSGSNGTNRPGAVSSGSEITASPAQLAAIRHGEGPCAVIAGPGSGKTFVLVERLRYLIGELEVDPSTILVMTFSRAAAQEMRNRFMNLDRNSCSGSSGGDVVFGTFHSVFYRILQESSGERLRMVGQEEKFRYLRHLCEIRPVFDPPAFKDSGNPGFTGSLSVENAGDRVHRSVLDRFRLPEKTTAEELQLLISRYKNGLPCAQPWLPALIRDYDRYLKSRGCLDFDDMILKCRDLLRDRPDIRAAWSSRFQWILVDEFQDVSPSQYDVLLLIAAPRQNLFIVGDDDQSIYGFRGADPLTMKKFLEDFGLADSKNEVPGRIFLTANYRCGRAILQAGAALIRENGNRIDKAFRAGASAPGRFACRPFTDRESQYLFITEELLAMTPAELGQTGVIFRTHAAARRFIPFLQEKEIPFVAEGSAPARKTPTEKSRILGELISYYRAAAGLEGKGADRRDLMKIMNCPERFLSGSFITGDFCARDRLEANAGYERRTVTEFLEDLETLNALSPAFSFRYLLDSVGYRAYAAEAWPKGEAILGELLLSSKEYKNSAAWLSYLERQLALEENVKTEKKSSMSDREQADSVPSGDMRVHILTMHACKGLEYDTVFIPDLNEGSVPAKQAWTRGQIEEERRLLYVAMTRAKKALTITFLEGTPDRPAAPSRFLRPLLKR